MKTSKCIVLAVLSGLVQACQAQTANGSPAEQRGQLAIAGHRVTAPLDHSNCGAADDTEEPYAEEADLLSICKQRPLESCETADELCQVLEAFPIDVEQRCRRPSEAVVCVAAPDQDALVDITVAVCRTDAQGNTWAIGGEIPPGWRPLAPDAPAEWHQDCDAIPFCED